METYDTASGAVKAQLWERMLEQDVLPLLRELGIGLVPFSPLGRGFLSGSARRAESYLPSDFRHLDPRLQGNNFDANMPAVKVIEDIAQENACTASQIALAWVLRQGDDIVPIPGTKRRSYLEQNVAALEIALSSDDVRRMEPALQTTAGERYNAERMAMIDR
jgi:aryl-alcohol dehydrogenase-like predicted oxidoreductase